MKSPSSMTLTRVAPAKGHGTLVLPSLQKLAKQELLQDDQHMIEGTNYLSDLNFGYMPTNQEQQLFDEKERKIGKILQQQKKRQLPTMPGEETDGKEISPER